MQTRSMDWVYESIELQFDVLLVAQMFQNIIRQAGIQHLVLNARDGIELDESCRIVLIIREVAS